MDSSYTIYLLVLGPIAIAILIMSTILRIKGDHKLVAPVKRKVCRFPGYTLSKEVTKLDEKSSYCMALLFSTPLVCYIAWSDKSPKGSPYFFLGLCAIAVGVIIFVLIRVTFAYRRMRMGLRGEQVVGQTLTELLRHGFYLVHDFPLDGENIDHVAVGPPGVFAIETKYRRKKKEKDGHKLFYNGIRLKFGDVVTAKPLVQSKRQAKKLSDLLRPIFDISETIPVVVYPGWWVEAEQQNVEVLVMNDKQALSHISQLPGKLPPATVSRIGAYLEDKVRDVEV